MNNKPLQLAPFGAKIPSGCKKIVDTQGNIVAYLKGSIIYDIRSGLGGYGACGYLDANNNLFDLRGRYIGTVQSIKSIGRALSIILAVVILAAFGLSMYYSSFILSKMGIDVYDPSYPEFDVANNSDEISWKTDGIINIFSNQSRSTGSFVPGSYGTYMFIVSNTQEKDVTYSMSFEEENDYHLAMLYRVKQNNAYILGNDKGEGEWLTIEELNQKDLYIRGDSKTLYSLEWKWDAYTNDENDTAAGENQGEYTILITLTAKNSSKI